MRAMYRAFNALARGGDIAAYVWEMWDPDCEYEPVEELEPVRGPEALVRWNERWFEVWDEVQVEVDELVPHGDAVLAGITLRGVASESSIEVSQRFFHVCECRNGKVLRMHEYLERSEALEAVGLSESDSLEGE